MLRFVAGVVLLAMPLAAETPLETARRTKQQGTPAAAANAYESALPGLRAAGDRAILAQALIEASQASLAAADYNRSFDRASEAAKLFRDFKDSAAESSALNTAGSAQLFRGQYEAALALFGEALALDRRRGDTKSEASRLGNIGNTYFYQGKYLDALKNYQAALPKTDAGSRHLALTNLALLHEQLGQDQRALDYYQQALAPGSALSPAERGQILSNIGTLYRRTGDAAKALASYDAAQKLFAQERLADAEIHVMQNAGIAHALDFGDTTQATRTFSEALRLAEATHNRREIAQAHVFRAESLYRADDLAAASRNFEAALAAAPEQWIALYGLARIARRRGDSAAALERLREAIAIVETAKPSPKSDFLPDKRAVYDAAIGIQLQSPTRDTEQLFHWFEQTRSRNLPAVQQRLSEGAALLKYWIGDGRIAALWITHTGAGIVDRAWTAADDAAVRARGTAPPILNGIPWQSIRRVVIVPDGVLCLLPFETLPLDSKLLIERMPVSYLPSISFLFRDTPTRRALPPWRKQSMAFDTENFKRGIPLLHLTARATLDLTDSNRSRIQFKSEVMYRPEVQALPLEGTDLVTLTSCDIDPGRRPRSEEIQGLTRAFLAAGVQATLSSLWTTDAAPFLPLFYENLAKGLPKDEALRQAKLRFLNRPQDWAAFVLYGNAETPIRPNLPWLQVTLPAAIIFSLLTLYLRRR